MAVAVGRGPSQESLEARLGRYPVGRYPVQHATAQFHLGAARLAAGERTAAADALTVAAQVFGRVGLRLEEAKATNMLGIALRDSGRPPEAEAAFRAAAESFLALGQPVEQAAASYNLGLVLRDAGDLPGAQQAWTAAQRSFAGAGRPAQAGACARERGASLLSAGDPAAARPLLEEAVELAERGGDLPGLGAALNALGLALLATDRPAEAAEAFRRALGGFPRAVRRAEYAMAKANLALAAARAGQESRARLAARQALAVAAAGPVRTQARQILAELPPGPGDDLLVVLDDEPPDRWTATVREEVLRLVEVAATERQSAVADFLEGALARPGTAARLTQSLLDVLLELPPAGYDTMIRAVVGAATEGGGRSTPDPAALRGVMRSAMARFPVPQWQRLATSVEAVAAERGAPLGWR